MRHFSALALLVLVLACAVVADAGGPAGITSLSDFALIEREMSGHSDDRDSQAIAQELSLLRRQLSYTAVEKRQAVLRRLTAQTKWGTPQRYAACYVCAWYGVDYTRARDYLLNVSFWDERRMASRFPNPRAVAAPFNLVDGNLTLLYLLYERNYDFRILHDILTCAGGEHIGETRCMLTKEAAKKHPRGVLHVARLSKQSRDLVWRLLHCGPDDDDNPILPYADDSGQRVLQIYTKRVAADPADPLSSLAKSLLRERRK